MKNLLPVSELEIQFVDGLDQMKDGLEKIKASESLYKNDPWFFDWVALIEARINVLKTAAECELNINESMLIHG